MTWKHLRNVAWTSELICGKLDFSPTQIDTIDMATFDVFLPAFENKSILGRKPQKKKSKNEGHLFSKWENIDNLGMFIRSCEQYRRFFNYK